MIRYQDRRDDRTEIGRHASQGNTIPLSATGGSAGRENTESIVKADRTVTQGGGAYGRRGSARAMTLLEVLAVIGIVSLLVAIVLPCTSRARAQGHRVACQANQREILIAMQYYAADFDETWYAFNHKFDFATGQYTGITYDGETPIRWAQVVDGNAVVALAMKPGSYVPADTDHPSRAEPSTYVPNWNILTCPATVNRIDRPEHLNDIVANRSLSSDDARQAGHSYSYLMGFESDHTGPKPSPGLNPAEYDCDPADGLPDCLKTPRRVARRASRIILLADGDNRVLEGQADADLINCPDNPADNHGVEGWNVGFADGHVDWLNRDETFWALYASGMQGQWTPGHSQPQTDPPGS